MRLRNWGDGWRKGCALALGCLALAADGVEWLVVKPVAHPGSLADLEASIKYLRSVFPPPAQLRGEKGESPMYGRKL